MSITSLGSADYCFAGASFGAMFARQKEEMKKAGKMKEAVSEEKEARGKASTSYEKLVRIDENVVEMCRNLSISQNVSYDTLTAFQLVLNEFMGKA